MPAPVPILVNRSGGTAMARGDRLEGEIRGAFDVVGLAVDLQLLDGGDIAAEAARLSSERLVVVGGGDGTLGSAAQALVDGGGAALGILPLGTRNHLAKQLGIVDLKGAAEAIAAGHECRIDLARVNGRAFVNNASVGLYPDMVRDRDASPLPKALAAIPASFATLKRMRHHRLRLRLPGVERDIVTPVLFVGNNHYSLDAGRVGERAALDDGMLSVYAVASRHRLALIGFALRAMRGRADATRDFAAIGDTPTLMVAGRSRSVDIALDGEVIRLAMPLEFSIEPKALTIRAPLERAAPTA